MPPHSTPPNTADHLDLLVDMGLDRRDAYRLRALLASPAPDTLEPGDLSDASPLKIALCALLVAATIFRDFTDAIRLLLAFIEPRQRTLDPFDLGRYLHLKGFVAWRLDDAVFFATRALNQSVQVLRDLGSPPARSYLCRVHDTFGQILAQQGLLEDARHELVLALEGRRHEQDEGGLALTLGNLGRLCVDAGDWAAGIGYLLEDLSIVERISPEKTALRAMLTGYIGTALMHDARYDEAREKFEASAELATRAEDPMGRALAEIGLGWLAVRRDLPQEVADRADKARSLLARSMSIPRFRDEAYARVTHLEAAATLRIGDVARAVELFRDAHAKMSKSGGISSVDRASILYDLAQALLVAGESREASLRLREALRCLDATAAERMRTEMETELKLRFPDAWLLHSAGRFVGQEQIEFLLGEAGRGGFRGEKKEIAILFSDVQGFTSLSEKLSPEEVVSLLNDLLSHMTRCIEGVGGMVDKFIGDAVMAVFSLPSSHTNDAERSVMAALSMRTELAWINRRLGESTPLALGIGIHFGHVVAGLIGSPQKRSYTVIGDVVNTASRLEGMSKQLGASILVSQEIVDRLDHKERFLLRPLGRFVPKGRSGAIRVYDVMGERDASASTAAIEDEINRATNALDAFAGRRFDEAAIAFRSLAHDCPDHATGYELLARRSEHHIVSPPPTIWDGEVELHEK